MIADNISLIPTPGCLPRTACRSRAHMVEIGPDAPAMRGASGAGNYPRIYRCKPRGDDRKHRGGYVSNAIPCWPRD